MSGYAKVQGHVFYTPRSDPEKLWAEMKAVVNGLATTYDWLEEHPPAMKWKELFDWPYYEVQVSHPGCETLAKAIEKVTRESATFSAFKAVDDCAYIQREYKEDVVSWGPGNLHMGTHGPDEYIPLDQLIAATKFYAVMAIEWCGLSSSSSL